MKSKGYKPYGMAIKYELKTYKYVGADYGDSPNTSRGIVFLIFHYLRKIRNKDERRYKYCHTYSDWKIHIENLQVDQSTNKEDFLHWILKNERQAKIELEIIKIVLIPLYIALLSLLDILLELHFSKIRNIIDFIMISIVIIVCSCFFYIKADTTVNFYEDLRKIIEEQVENK